MRRFTEDICVTARAPGSTEAPTEREKKQQKRPGAAREGGKERKSADLGVPSGETQAQLGSLFLRAVRRCVCVRVCRGGGGASRAASVRPEGRERESKGGREGGGGARKGGRASVSTCLSERQTCHSPSTRAFSSPPTPPRRPRVRRYPPSAPPRDPPCTQVRAVRKRRGRRPRQPPVREKTRSDSG